MVGSAASQTAYLFGFGLDQPSVTWSRDVKIVNDVGKSVSPIVSLIGDVLAIEEEIDQFRHRLAGASIRTGETLWSVSCPRGYTTSGFVHEILDRPNTVDMNCGNGGAGASEHF